MALTPPPPRQPRNPGPEWGYRFLATADAWLPRRVFDLLLGAGTWVAVAIMPEPRRHSRAYLEVVLGRPARWRDSWRHFFAFAQSLLARLRAAGARRHQCRSDASCQPLLQLMASGRPVLLGTFHFGDSDLLGFLLGDFQRRIHLVRLRVGNSSDTTRLAERFGEWIRFIWSNEPAEMLFVLKAAIEAGDCVAMKCDRPDYSSKLEPFHFLGAQRLFPFTIYHLALIFQQPVGFALGFPVGPGETVVACSSIFEPGACDRETGLVRAREHFQSVLHWLEAFLRRHPFLWFNFTPLNPVALPGTARHG